MGRTIGRTLKRAAAGSAALMMIAVVALAILEVRRERRLTDRYSPPGDMISVGTHRLHLHCQGSGAPPVLLDAGSGLAFLNWNAVQAGLAPITTVCSYDRSGLGWSETGPTEPSANQATTELNALLDASGIRGPWIVVGHSLGGLYAQQFLNLHRDRVAAAVLVDAPHDQLWEQVPQYMESVTPGFRDSLTPLLAALGVHRWSRPDVPETDPTWVSRELHATAKHVRRTAAEWWAIPHSARQVAEQRTDWGDTPVVVMQAGNTDYPDDWSDRDVATIDAIVTANHMELVSRSSRGRYLLLEESGHGIPWERPAAVIAAADALVREIR